MRALLDTHAFLWAIAGDRRLSRRARRVIVDKSNVLYLSVASGWELLLKAQAGKLKVEGEVGAFLMEHLAQAAIDPLPVEWRHMLQVERLPLHHRDPFDRLLVAQAQIENLAIITRDADVRRYDVKTVW